MAWEELNGIAPADWPFTGRNVITSIEFCVDISEVFSLLEPSVYRGTITTTAINRLSSIAYPGFDDGYSPCSVSNDIRNNFNEGCDGGGDGGGTRPTAGMLYPRGDC